MMLGWCIDANDLEIRTDKPQERLHKACKHGSLASKGVLQCSCWCHTGQPKPAIRIPTKRKRRVSIENATEDVVIPAPKKRGRPKGSKNKPKLVSK